MSDVKSHVVVATDLIDYSLQLQDAILQGYRVSLDNNLAPIVMGYTMCTTLLKDETHNDTIEIAVSVDTKEAQEAIAEIAASIPEGLSEAQEEVVVEVVKESLSVEAKAVGKASGRPRKA